MNGGVLGPLRRFSIPLGFFACSAHALYFVAGSLVLLCGFLFGKPSRLTTKYGILARKFSLDKFMSLLAIFDSLKKVLINELVVFTKILGVRRKKMNNLYRSNKAIALEGKAQNLLFKKFNPLFKTLFFCQLLSLFLGLSNLLNLKVELLLPNATAIRTHTVPLMVAVAVPIEDAQITVNRPAFFGGQTAEVCRTLQGFLKEAHGNFLFSEKV